MAAKHSSTSEAEETMGSMIPSAPQSRTLEIRCLSMQGILTIKWVWEPFAACRFSNSLASVRQPCSKSNNNQSKPDSEVNSEIMVDPTDIHNPFFTFVGNSLFIIR